MVKLSEMVKNTRKARRALRSAGIPKPNKSWSWEKVPPEVKKVLKGL